MTSPTEPTPSPQEEARSQHLTSLKSAIWEHWKALDQKRCVTQLSGSLYREDEASLSNDGNTIKGPATVIQKRYPDPEGTISVRFSATGEDWDTYLVFTSTRRDAPIAARLSPSDTPKIALKILEELHDEMLG